MQYAIMQFNKMRNATAFLENHHGGEGYYIIEPQNPYRVEIESRIDKAGCKVRRDSIKLVDTLVAATSEFFKNCSAKDTRTFFELATEFLTSEVGEQNIFSVVVHMSEQTPHMHFCFTPITNDGRLSAKEIVGNRQKLVEWQDKFHKQLSAFYLELERNK